VRQRPLQLILKSGEVSLLENLRFHAEEEAGVMLLLQKRISVVAGRYLCK
jgi:3-phosphoglycerate kinase